MSVGPIRTLALALGGSIVLATGCTDEPAVAPSAPPTQATGAVTQAEADGTVAGLCELVELGGDDRDAANAVFYDQSHAGLHRIAADAERADRAAAALLLERKQLVEQDLLDAPIPSTFRHDLMELLRATSAAIEAADLDPSGCPPG